MLGGLLRGLRLGQRFADRRRGAKKHWAARVALLLFTFTAALRWAQSTLAAEVLVAGPRYDVDRHPDSSGPVPTAADRTEPASSSAAPASSGSGAPAAAAPSTGGWVTGWAQSVVSSVAAAATDNPVAATAPQIPSGSFPAPGVSVPQPSSGMISNVASRAAPVVADTAGNGVANAAGTVEPVSDAAGAPTDTCAGEFGYPLPERRSPVTGSPVVSNVVSQLPPVVATNTGDALSSATGTVDQTAGAPTAKAGNLARPDHNDGRPSHEGDVGAREMDGRTGRQEGRGSGHFHFQCIDRCEDNPCPARLDARHGREDGHGWSRDDDQACR